MLAIKLRKLLGFCTYTAVQSTMNLNEADMNT